MNSWYGAQLCERLTFEWTVLNRQTVALTSVSKEEPGKVQVLQTDECVCT